MLASAADRAAVRKFQRREHFRALSEPKRWDDSGQPADPRICPECKRTLPNASGYWPGWMSMPDWWSGGDIPCLDCFDTVLARYRPLA